MARRVLPHPAGRFLAATGIADVLKLRLSLKRRRYYTPRSLLVKQSIAPAFLRAPDHGGLTLRAGSAYALRCLILRLILDGS